MPSTAPGPQQSQSGSLSFCLRCNKSLSSVQGHTFQNKLDHSTALKCTTCSLLHMPMIKRSTVTCLIVGSLLTLLNQGDLIIFGQFSSAMLWKIPLTYFVPFGVSTLSGLLNTRR